MDSNLTEFTKHIEAAVQAGQEPAVLIPGDFGVRWQVTPEGFDSHELNLEEYGPHPRRKKGKPTFEDVRSFHLYLQRHKEDGTGVYLHEGAFVAVIDGHEAAAAGWGEHRAFYTLKKTEPWAAWLAMNKGRVSQQQFAEFIDARMGEIAAPAGAVLAEVIANLTVKQNVDFQSKINLTNGQVNFIYNESLEEGGGQGSIRIPSAFTLALVCYEGMPTEEVTGKLRWSFEKGKVAFGIDLGDEPRRVREAAEQQAIADIETNTQLTVLRGAP